MTCAACSNSALMSLNGIIKAFVALLQNKEDVTFDPTSLQTIHGLRRTDTPLVLKQFRAVNKFKKGCTACKYLNKIEIITSMNCAIFNRVRHIHKRKVLVVCRLNGISAFTTQF